MNQRSKFFFSDIELKYQHSSYDLKYKKIKMASNNVLPREVSDIANLLLIMG